MADLVIRNGTIVDGTKAALWYRLPVGPVAGDGGGHDDPDRECVWTG